MIRALIVAALAFAFIAPTAHAHDKQEHAPKKAALKPADEAKVGDRTVCPVTDNEFTVEADTDKIEHDGKKMTDADCVAMCIKKGAKYVFVAADGKVYQIANQNSKQIATHAGHDVELTGSLKGDTITATTLKMPAEKK